ncbi:hypothetical protein B0F90DRAFT_1743576 [Multifurca ochricompacta]|uniref:FAD-binding PCMH-type domain-containing protein n=1 Tax=Multifurca ochricompacta TaxID=376703 RepID=A0AAD4M0H3_9AGAM|nr:hypothetical protein B0F90DRAFT_1743576 [Multifurca ochricompacta]
MTRFNQTQVNNATETIDVGSGLTMDQTYTALAPTGLNVVAGRIPTVGIAGLTLGGGFAFMSSQYGLTVDNMAGYELVLPNGTITNVTSKNEDLWFALRGGGNNFGIVTKFSYKAIPQGQVWGGTRNYTVDQLEHVKEAVVKFQQKKDTKAALNAGIFYTPNGAISSAVIFYDAPTPPRSDVSTRSFVDLFNSLHFINSPPTARGYFNGVPIAQYSSSVIDAIVNQTLFWGAKLSALDENTFVAATMEPFDSDLFSHGSDSAYPPDRSQAIFPTAVTFTFSNASLDATVARALRNYSDAVTAAAIADGQNVSHAAVYPNYALFDTPVENMYGANLPRLGAINGRLIQRM